MKIAGKRCKGTKGLRRRRGRKRCSNEAGESGYCVKHKSTLSKLGVLLVGDIDPSTALPPSGDAVVEVGNILGVAAKIEGSQILE